MTRSYVPVSGTGGRWLLHKVAREQRSGIAGDPQGYFAEDVYYYDGDDFVGLSEGELTQGKVTRQVSRVNDDTQITVFRQRFDTHGNAVEALDPLATIGGPAHRRLYSYDDDGLRVVRVDVLNQSPDGTPYRLRREMQYDLLFDRVTLASSWLKVEGESVVTSRDPTAYTYDVFGRVSSLLLPGDSGLSPTVELTYDLGSPSTRLITRRRSAAGGVLDIETVGCVDGRGRTYQTRRKIKDGEYIVDGFAVFNLRAQQVAAFQSYTSSSDQCDESPPAGVRSTKFRYDGVGRPIETVHPDESSPGGASSERMVYAPLRTLSFDAEDNDPSSRHHDTPQVQTIDGLGRPVTMERNLVDTVAVTHIEYDELGNMAGYIDAEGHRKVQTYDALGRLLTIADPNTGTTTFEYDDAGNVVQRTDGRGVSVAFRFDGLNREVERFDPRDREATLIATEWDDSANCDPARCPNATGRVAARSYPGGADYLGYDVRRRLLSQVRVIEGHTYELRNQYDNADRIVRRVYPDGRTLDYEFDGASRITAIPGVLDAVTYNPQGLPRAWQRSNGVVDERTYDDRLRLAGLGVRRASGEMLQAIELVRDRANNILSVRNLADDALAPQVGYTHDAWYRSTEVRRGVQTDRMAFDAIDNTLRRNDTARSYADGLPGAPQAIGTEALSYDDAGHLISSHGFEQTWDFLGRLVQSVGAEGNVRSIYGPNHLRVARHNDGETTHYVAADFEVRDGITVIYPRIGEQRISRLESADYATTWLGDSAASPDGQLTAGVVFRRQVADEADIDSWLTASARRMLVSDRPTVVGLHQDQLGSITLSTGQDGRVLGRRVFGVYGNDVAGAGFVDRYGFTGQEHEPHTNFVHFAHRFLSTRTGQWASPDPAFRALTPRTVSRLHEAIGRYVYVLNNPGTFVDPTGLNTLSRSRSRSTSGSGGRGRARSRRSRLSSASIGSIESILIKVVDTPSQSSLPVIPRNPSVARTASSRSLAVSTSVRPQRTGLVGRGLRLLRRAGRNLGAGVNQLSSAGRNIRRRFRRSPAPAAEVEIVEVSMDTLVAEVVDLPIADEIASDGASAPTARVARDFLNESGQSLMVKSLRSRASRQSSMNSELLRVIETF